MDIFKLPPKTELQEMIRLLGITRDRLENDLHPSARSQEWLNLNKVHNLMISLSTDQDDIEAFKRVLFAFVGDKTRQQADEIASDRLSDILCDK